MDYSGLSSLHQVQFYFVVSRIIFPSLGLLYLLDDSVDACLTIKAIGSQWYWSYEYSDCFYAYAGPTLVA